MTGDANGAIAGAYDAGAEAVLVNDSHWIMRNLLVHDLDKRARVIKGFHKPLCMLQGLDDSFGAAVFVGYHSCAGTEGGVLNHTMLGKEVQNIFLNGEATGETRLNAGLAGHYGVPVALVAGDVAVCEEAKRVLPWVATVAVKEGIDKYSAILKHPEVAQAEIREATANALKAKAAKPYVLKPPIKLGVEWEPESRAPRHTRCVRRASERRPHQVPDKRCNRCRCPDGNVSARRKLGLAYSPRVPACRCRVGVCDTHGRLHQQYVFGRPILL